MPDIDASIEALKGLDEFRKATAERKNALMRRLVTTSPEYASWSATERTEVLAALDKRYPTPTMDRLAKQAKLQPEPFRHQANFLDSNLITGPLLSGIRAYKNLKAPAKPAGKRPTPSLQRVEGLTRAQQYLVQSAEAAGIPVQVEDVQQHPLGPLTPLGAPLSPPKLKVTRAPDPYEYIAGSGPDFTGTGFLTARGMANPTLSTISAPTARPFTGQLARSMWDSVMGEGFTDEVHRAAEKGTALEKLASMTLGMADPETLPLMLTGAGATRILALRGVGSLISRGAISAPKVQRLALWMADHSVDLGLTTAQTGAAVTRFNSGDIEGGKAELIMALGWIPAHYALKGGRAASQKIAAVRNMPRVESQIEALKSVGTAPRIEEAPRQMPTESPIEAQVRARRAELERVQAESRPLLPSTGSAMLPWPELPPYTQGGSLSRIDAVIRRATAAGRTEQADALSKRFFSAARTRSGMVTQAVMQLPEPSRSAVIVAERLDGFIGELAKRHGPDVAQQIYSAYPTSSVAIVKRYIGDDGRKMFKALRPEEQRAILTAGRPKEVVPDAGSIQGAAKEDGVVPEGKGTGQVPQQEGGGGVRQDAGEGAAKPRAQEEALAAAERRLEVARAERDREKAAYDERKRSGKRQPPGARKKLVELEAAFGRAYGEYNTLKFAQQAPEPPAPVEAAPTVRPEPQAPEGVEAPGLVGAQTKPEFVRSTEGSLALAQVAREEAHKVEPPGQARRLRGAVTFRGVKVPIAGRMMKGGGREPVIRLPFKATSSEDAPAMLESFGIPKGVDPAEVSRAMSRGIVRAPLMPQGTVAIPIGRVRTPTSQVTAYAQVKSAGTRNTVDGYFLVDHKTGQRSGLFMRRENLTEAMGTFNESILEPLNDEMHLWAAEAARPELDVLGKLRQPADRDFLLERKGGIHEQVLDVLADIETSRGTAGTPVRGPGRATQEGVPIDRIAGDPSFVPTDVASEQALEQIAKMEAATGGEPNFVVTDAAVAAARARLSKPEANIGGEFRHLPDLAVIVAYHVERGTTKLQELVRAVSKDLGTNVPEQAIREALRATQQLDDSSGFAEFNSGLSTKMVTALGSALRPAVDALGRLGTAAGREIQTRSMQAMLEIRRRHAQTLGGKFGKLRDAVRAAARKTPGGVEEASRLFREGREGASPTARAAASARWTPAMRKLSEEYTRLVEEYGEAGYEVGLGTERVSGAGPIGGDSPLAGQTVKWFDPQVGQERSGKLLRTTKNFRVVVETGAGDVTLPEGTVYYTKSAVVPGEYVPRFMTEETIIALSNPDATPETQAIFDRNVEHIVKTGQVATRVGHASYRYHDGVLYVQSKPGEKAVPAAGADLADGHAALVKRAEALLPTQVQQAVVSMIPVARALPGGVGHVKPHVPYKGPAALERARTGFQLLPDAYMPALDAMTIHIENMNQRLAYARAFGRSAEDLQKLVAMHNSDVHADESAAIYANVDTILRIRDPALPRESTTSRNLREWDQAFTVTRLLTGGLTTLKQFGTKGNTGTVLGNVGSAKATAQLIRDVVAGRKEIQAVLDSGVVDSVLQNLLLADNPETLPIRVSSAAMKAVGTEGADRLLRFDAAIAGRIAVADSVRRLVPSPSGGYKNNAAYRLLRDWFKYSDEEIGSMRSRWDPKNGEAIWQGADRDDLLSRAYYGGVRTQGITAPEQSSAFLWRYPQAKWLLTLQAFNLAQARTFGWAVTEAGRGNVTPILRMLVNYGVWGAAYGAAEDALLKRRDKGPIAARLAYHMMRGGMLGAYSPLAASEIRSATGRPGPKGWASIAQEGMETFSPPTVNLIFGDLADTAEGVKLRATGRPAAALHHYNLNDVIYRNLTPYKRVEDIRRSITGQAPYKTQKERFKNVGRGGMPGLESMPRLPELPGILGAGGL